MKDHGKNSPRKGQMQDGKPLDAELQGYARIDAMMPWITREELQELDTDLVSEGLADTAEFKAMLAREGALEAVLEAIAADEAAESADDADAAWAKFKARLPEKLNVEKTLATIEGGPSQPKALAQGAGRMRASGTRRASAWRRLRLPQTGVGWLATAQTAAIAALAFLFIPGQSDPQEDEYRLLSSDKPAAQFPEGNVILVLDPSSDQATTQALLAEVGARIVDGPMQNGGYVVKIEDEELEAGLAVLQSNEAVVLAQPLIVGNVP